MPLVREFLDGRVHYRQDPLDPSRPVLMTGPVKGPITLSDGTVYDVSGDYIEVASPEHAGELDHHIGLRHEVEGHPDNRSRGTEEYDPLADEYDHVCTDRCGPAARSDAEADAAFDARLQRLGHGSLIGGDRYRAARGELNRLRGVARGEREI